MAKIITITGIDGNGGLILDDHGKSHVNHKEEIFWHIKKDCGVEDIIDISAKDSPYNTQIWANDPDRVGKTKVWRGAIKTGGVGGREWNYYIDWEDRNGETRHFDPKIIVNSTEVP